MLVKRSVTRIAGDVVNGVIRHGKGVHTWKDGSVYEGDWKHDRANGQGKFTHSDGSVYSGGWRDDKAEGFGVFHCENGSEYRGQWKDDYQHGFGKVPLLPRAHSIGNLERRFFLRGPVSVREKGREGRVPVG